MLESSPVARALSGLILPWSGTMGDLLDSLTEERVPKISGRENLGTMALVDACYRSLDEHRPVRIQEIVEGGKA